MKKLISLLALLVVVGLVSAWIPYNSRKEVLTGRNEFWVDEGESIASAVLRAQSGDLIHLNAGTFTEREVTINKRLFFEFEPGAVWSSTDTLWHIVGVDSVDFIDGVFYASARGSLGYFESGGLHKFTNCYFSSKTFEMTGDTLVFYEGCRFDPDTSYNATTGVGYRSTGVGGLARIIGSRVGLQGYDVDPCYGLTAANGGIIHMIDSKIYATDGFALISVGNGSSVATYYGLVGTRDTGFSAVKLSENGTGFLQYTMFSNVSTSTPTILVRDTSSVTMINCYTRNDEAGEDAIGIQSQEDSYLWDNEWGGNVTIDTCNVVGSDDGTTYVYGDQRFSNGLLIDTHDLTSFTQQNEKTEMYFGNMSATMTADAYLNLVQCSGSTGLTGSSQIGYIYPQTVSITAISGQIKMAPSGFVQDTARIIVTDGGTDVDTVNVYVTSSNITSFSAKRMAGEKILTLNHPIACRFDFVDSLATTLSYVHVRVEVEY